VTSQSILTPLSLKSVGQPNAPVEQRTSMTTNSSGLLTAAVSSTSRYTNPVDPRKIAQLLQQPPQYALNTSTSAKSAIPNRAQYDSNLTELQHIKNRLQSFHTVAPQRQLPMRSTRMILAVYPDGTIRTFPSPVPLSFRTTYPVAADYPWSERREKWAPPYHSTSDVSGPTSVKW
jgi:hypothetical protein